MIAKPKKREERESFDVVQESGGGLSSFLDFGEAVGAGAGASELIREDVGVGSDDTKEIVEGMGDDLVFGGRRDVRVRDVQ